MDHFKRAGLTASAGILLASSGAIAADLPSRKGPPVFAAASLMSWGGFYLGGVGSVGMMTSNMQDYRGRIAKDAPHDSKFGGAFGLTLGYNMQRGSLVYGIEADGSIANFNSKSGKPGTFGYASARWNGYATLRGRAGFAVDRSFIYATAGAAFVSSDYSMQYTFGTLIQDYFPPKKQIQTGFAVGVG